MNLVNLTEVNGWLPSGLVLNTALTVKSPSATATYVHVLPMVPLADYGKSFVGVQQAGKDRMIVLEGRFYTPVVLLDLLQGLWDAPAIEEGAPAGVDFSQPVDPFASPCMLMCPARFTGRVKVFSGTDIPSTSLDISCGSVARPSYYAPAWGTRANGASQSESIKSLVVGGCCDIYLPSKGGASKMVVADSETLAPSGVSVYGLNCAPLSDAMLTLFGLQSGWAALCRLGAIPDIALQYVRRFTAAHQEDGVKYFTGYSPWLKIATRDGGCKVDAAATVAVVMPSVRMSRSYLTLADSSCVGLVSGQQSVRELLKANVAYRNYYPFALAAAGYCDGATEESLIVN